MKLLTLNSAVARIEQALLSLVPSLNRTDTAMVFHASGLLGYHMHASHYKVCHPSPRRPLNSGEAGNQECMQKNSSIPQRHAHVRLMPLIRNHRAGDVQGFDSLLPLLHVHRHCEHPAFVGLALGVRVPEHGLHHEQLVRVALDAGVTLVD